MPKGVPSIFTRLKTQIDELKIQNAFLVAERDAMRSDAAALQDSLTLAEEKLANTQEAYSRMLGWQDCAREMLEKLHG